ncbi:hypothetical protein ACIBEJ_00860 [Nonomuraea sp. NPDC050790]|uniref:hypothetical protein n=1 Tax=Nonomuraea sp. NPDC050790 TaxID=3364371 RepID=UPI0037891BE5
MIRPRARSDAAAVRTPKFRRENVMCGCNKKRTVSEFVVVYNDGTESSPYATAYEAGQEKNRSGATAPVKIVTKAARA